MRLSFAFLLGCAAAALPGLGSAQPAPPQPDVAPARVVLTAQQDHQRLMDLLGFTSLRPGANGSNPQATNAANYDEAKGMFLAAAGAGPVYKLLGKKDLGTTEFPPIETSLVEGDVAFRQHSGGHTDAPNWPTFRDGGRLC